MAEKEDLTGRVKALEDQNAFLKEATGVCLDALFEACMYGVVKRSREVQLKEYLAKISV